MQNITQMRLYVIGDMSKSTIDIIFVHQKRLLILIDDRVYQ